LIASLESAYDKDIDWVSVYLQDADSVL
jgi:hypothetical protein